MITREQFAQMLTGREYGNEITQDEKRIAAQNGLVVVFGASDDLMEIRGAIHDEYGVYDGGIVYLDSDGIFELECEDKDCKYYEIAKRNCKTIEALWCESGQPFTWTYKTDIPHSTFDIFEDEEEYCKRIVFELAALKSEVAE